MEARTFLYDKKPCFQEWKRAWSWSRIAISVKNMVTQPPITSRTISVNLVIVC